MRPWIPMCTRPCIFAKSLIRSCHSCQISTIVCGYFWIWKGLHFFIHLVLWYCHMFALHWLIAWFNIASTLTYSNVECCFNVRKVTFVQFALSSFSQHWLNGLKGIENSGLTFNQRNFARWGDIIITCINFWNFHERRITISSSSITWLLRIYSSAFPISLAKPKSETFARFSSPRRMFLAAKSRWTNWN